MEAKKFHQVINDLHKACIASIINAVANQMLRQRLKVFMKRNFLPHFFVALERSVKITGNFFDRIFVTALLFEIFNFILFENNTTSDVIVHNHFSKKLY